MNNDKVIYEKGICNLIIKTNRKIMTIFCPIKGIKTLNPLEASKVFEKIQL